MPLPRTPRVNTAQVGLTLGSIADHRRSVQVCIVRGLLEHKIRQIGPREPGATLFAHVAYPVLPLLLSFDEHRCAYDHPLEAALPYHHCLSYRVLQEVSLQELKKRTDR